MVSNKLDYDAVQARASELDFPASVLEFFEGLMGQPYGGFPEPLRTNALRGRPKLDKRHTSMPLRAHLDNIHPCHPFIRHIDIRTHYPHTCVPQPRKWQLHPNAKRKAINHPSTIKLRQFHALTSHLPDGIIVCKGRGVRFKYHSLIHPSHEQVNKVQE